MDPIPSRDVFTPIRHEIAEGEIVEQNFPHENLQSELNELAGCHIGSVRIVISELPPQCIVGLPVTRGAGKSMTGHDFLLMPEVIGQIPQKGRPLPQKIFYLILFRVRLHPMEGSHQRGVFPVDPLISNKPIFREFETA